MLRKYILFVASLMVVQWCWSLAGQVHAYSGPRVVITEVQTGSVQSANEEFIEIKNLGEDSVDVTGWRLEYKSATGLTWSSKATLHGELHPGGTLLAASTNYLPTLANVSFAAGISKTGGNIRLASTEVSDNTVYVHDALGWGNGNSAEGGAAAVFANEGKSMSRIITVNGEVQDSDNNSLDFVVNDTPTPEAYNPMPELPPEVLLDETLPELPVTPETAPTTPEPALPELPPAKPVVSILITELLPNPASPTTDGEGEYIELYNSGDTAISLKDYKLQTGLKSSYSYTFLDVSVEPGTYKAFYSKQTGLSLSNTSGKARLVAPDDTVIYETAVYGTAKDGLAWTLADGQWVWSTQLTPAAENVVVTVAAAEAAKATAKAEAKAAAKTTKKAATPKAPKAAKTTKPKTAKLKNTANVRKVYTDPAKTDLKTPIHYGVLAGIGSITLLYALYEYRTDFQNRFFQLRRYLAYRRGHRQTIKGQ